MAYILRGAYKYDPARLEILANNVEIGMTDENAVVNAFGIDRSTYYLWTGNNSYLQPQEKLDILNTIDIAKSKRNKMLSEIIVKCAQQGDGKLALDYLKRLERATYGDSTKVQSDNTNTNLNTDIEGDESKTTEEKLQEVLMKIKELKEE